MPATVRDNASGREYVVRCRCLLAADGGGGWPAIAVVEPSVSIDVSR